MGWGKSHVRAQRRLGGCDFLVGGDVTRRALTLVAARSKMKNEGGEEQCGGRVSGVDLEQNTHTHAALTNNPLSLLFIPPRHCRRPQILCTPFRGPETTTASSREPEVSSSSACLSLTTFSRRYRRTPRRRSGASARVGSLGRTPRPPPASIPSARNILGWCGLE